MKKLLILAGCILSFSCFAADYKDAQIALAPNCPIADINDPVHFCDQFKVAAKCYCDTIFPGKCPADMNQLYQLMMSGHRNLEDACRFQQGITGLPAAICVQHWTYQRQHCH